MYKVEYYFFNSICIKIFEEEGEAIKFALENDGKVYKIKDNIPF